MTYDPFRVPQNASDMLAVARVLLHRFYLSQEFADLFGVVLATAHVVDWHFTTSHDRQFREKDRDSLPKREEYNTLLDLANALKHGLFPRSSAPASEARKLVLKRIDAWSGDDEDEPLDGWTHLGQPDYWIVQHGDRRHSVFVLCEEFLDEIEKLIDASPAALGRSRLPQ